MRIRVCIPFYKDFESTKSGLVELENCKEHEFVIEPRPGTYTHSTRNSLINDKRSQEICQEPVEGFDAFLDIDSDIHFTLKDVLTLIEHDKDIVGFPYLKQGTTDTYECGVFGDIIGSIERRFDTTEKGLNPVGYLGNGFRLTKREVFSKSEYPWAYSVSTSKVTGSKIGCGPSPLVSSSLSGL